MKKVIGVIKTGRPVQVGDAVFLGSNEDFPMTVEHIFQGGRIGCLWIDSDGHLHREVFDHRVLKG